MRIIARDLRPGGKGADLDSATVVQDPGVMEILNLGSLIRQMKVYRADDIQAAHWEIYLASDGPCIKVDLVDAGYRILYGANPRVGPDGTLETITLDPAQPKTLGEVIRAVAMIAESKGPRTGTDQYNCQDFAILLMQTLRMSAAHIFPYELRRAVTKHRPPMIVDRDGNGDLRRQT